MRSESAVSFYTQFTSNNSCVSENLCTVLFKSKLREENIIFVQKQIKLSSKKMQIVKNNLLPEHDYFPEKNRFRQKV